MTETEAFDPVVASVASDFVLSAGHAALPDPAFTRWVVEIDALPQARRMAVAIDLTALALRFQTMAPPGSAANAVAQLSLLAALALQDPERADEMFAHAGVDAAARRLLGVDSNVAAPTQSELDSQQKLSPMALRIQTMAGRSNDSDDQ